MCVCVCVCVYTVLTDSNQSVYLLRKFPVICQCTCDSTHE